MSGFKLLVLTGMLSFLFLAGCGEKQELADYKENMTLFYTEIVATGEVMNAIVADSSDAVTSLLGSLDSMNRHFQYLASIEVPDEFSNTEAIADEASAYMNQAVSLYHDAYASEEYKENLISAAVQNYQAAMKRVGYIAILLQGEIPEGADVIMSEGEDTELEPYSK